MFFPVSVTVRKKKWYFFLNYLCTTVNYLCNTFNEIDILLNYMEDHALLSKDIISLNPDIQYWILGIPCTLFNTGYESGSNKLEFNINTSKLSYMRLYLYQLFIISALFIIDSFQVAFGSALINNGTGKALLFITLSIKNLPAKNTGYLTELIIEKCIKNSQRKWKV